MITTFWITTAILLTISSYICLVAPTGHEDEAGYYDDDDGDE